MSSHARHRAPGRASTPISNLPLNAKTATIAVTVAGVAVSAAPADAVSNSATTVTAPEAAAAKAAVSTTTVAKTRSYKAASAMSRAQVAANKRSYAHYTTYHRNAYGSYSNYLKKSPHFHTAAVAPQSVSSARTRLLTIMRRYEGIYYRYGGTTPAGFDCSGFTQYVYRQVGVRLPRTAESQRFAGRTVSRAAGRAGDLVYMPGHIGIYLGNGMMYDSPRTGKAIGARRIWASNYQIVRVLP